ncbi:EAL domain-containing protein [Vibrio sp. S17_S38]|uniref:EAL domain-containing protein n=1 Tax=Vibrio sp. S17_S38 TaxID=2720229 RepID=UPI0031455845
MAVWCDVSVLLFIVIIDSIRYLGSVELRTDTKTGYNSRVSLYIHLCKLDELACVHNTKLSFIDLIGSDAVSAPLVDNIIDLARRLNLSLTAEGVEDQVQVDYLKENGVDYLQGYFYGKPIPLDEFIRTYLK